MTVTQPQGFLAAGKATGLRKSGRPDLAIVQNLGPEYTCAGVFTSNRVYAAPVGWSRQVVAGGQAQAVVINSGNANACTGDQGRADAQAMAEELAAALNIDTDKALVCSTGIIGQAMDMPTVKAGIHTVAAALSEGGGEEASLAILTTDTVPKTVVVAGGGYSIGGMAKGAGMLAPALATMICVITTDAALSPEVAQRALAAATEASFNRLDSDGCMSTNDTVLLLASGASGVSPDEAQFTALLTGACEHLARGLLADAEGANHDVEIRITGAASVEGALAGARAISRSNLVKTAIYGNDPNWGRILSQIGTVPAEVLPFDPEAVDVSINGVMVCRAGGLGEDRELVDMTPRQCHIQVDLHDGDHEAAIWTSDLTHEYVHINGDYTT